MVGRALVIALCVGWASMARAREPVVVVDPGHGGQQDGAMGPRGLLEKDLALALARKLKAQLLASARVVLTREQDRSLGLPERVQAANRQKPDLFISLHANSMPTRHQRASTEGVETYFLSAHASGEDARKVAARENAEAPGAHRGSGGDTLAFILADLQRAEAHVESSRLAYAVHQRLVEATGAQDRGVQQAPFFVLMGVDAPAILVEVGFISHPLEGKRLMDEAYQDKLVTALAEGIRVFLAKGRPSDGHAGAANR